MLQNKQVLALIAVSILTVTLTLQQSVNLFTVHASESSQYDSGRNTYAFGSTIMIVSGILPFVVGYFSTTQVRSYRHKILKTIRDLSKSLRTNIAFL
jgi:hypothetical protein